MHMEGGGSTERKKYPEQLPGRDQLVNNNDKDVQKVYIDNENKLSFHNCKT